MKKTPPAATSPTPAAKVAKAKAAAKTPAAISRKEARAAAVIEKGKAALALARKFLEHPKNLPEYVASREARAFRRGDGRLEEYFTEADWGIIVELAGLSVPTVSIANMMGVSTVKMNDALTRGRADESDGKETAAAALVRLINRGRAGLEVAMLNIAINAADEKADGRGAQSFLRYLNPGQYEVDTTLDDERTAASIAKITVAINNVFSPPPPSDKPITAEATDVAS